VIFNQISHSHGMTQLFFRSFSFAVFQLFTLRTSGADMTPNCIDRVYISC
jgi:hypothetical protein